ncbi:MAG: oligosaccharide flippase family protein, partial [Syntrophales bacterium LBB04]|nr:oligosaccharide flippase family protein [Syntrophales bacterium LBB04]
MHSDLKVKTVSNIGYNTFAKVGGLGLSTFARVILARNLTSVDYGIVGFASIFIGFLGRFDDLGISNAVVQKNELDERGIYTGFTIKAILSLAVFAAAFVFSPLTNAFFDNSAIEGVIKILSLNFIIGIFSFLPTCVLTRRLNYKKLFVPQASSVLISSLLSIALALNGFKYWSIVLASVGSTAVYVIILNIIKPVRIRFSLDKNIVSGLIKFGGSLFLSGIVVFVI